MAASFILRALEKIAPFVGKYHRQSQLNLLEHIYSPFFVVGTVADLQKKRYVINWCSLQKVLLN